MINFSIWNFTKFEKLEDFVETAKENGCHTQMSAKSYGSHELKNEIGVIEDFQELLVKKIRVADEDIEYVALGTNYQVCRSNSENDEYEVKDVTEKIVVFEKNNVVKVVILAS